MSYASQINQVFMNILSNAAQAIDDKGEIWIKTQVKTPIKSSIQNQRVNRNNFVEISIRDSGKGIAPEAVEKIFDPFFTTKAIDQGTGLGISISYGNVKKHDGNILVSSQLEQLLRIFLKVIHVAKNKPYSKSVPNAAAK